ncbi:MAG: DUF1624 domain-containing protein [Sphingobacteriales bacterium]|nr:MAG: DUF1624 domain-containing protein [Sphingobacteriales bacterium]
MQPTITKNRIQSIDVLRGFVMVIMALDHIRDFLYKADLSKAADAALDPTNMQTTFPALFFTRWITHFCAPIFVFLAGTSIYLMCQRKTKKELSGFLIKRGLWLIFVELVIITFGWTFNPSYNLFIMQVIWAIGVSMVLLGILIHLPIQAIFVIGLIIVAGHNIMDIPSVSSGLKGTFLSDLLYFSNFSVHPLWGNHFVIIVYAFLPWTGVMLLGFCFGMFYKKDVDPLYRRKMLLRLGAALIILFLVLRFTNIYGDPLPWSAQPRGPVYTFLSFLNLNKYPPSLLYLCMTIGPGLLFLALIEKVQNNFTAVFNIYGRVPMLYYILHFYLIHLIVVVVFFAQGFGTKDIVPEGIPFFFKPNGLGFGLWGVYAVWAIVLVILYPICKKYNHYKSTHTHWWLSYL